MTCCRYPHYNNGVECEQHNKVDQHGVKYCDHEEVQIYGTSNIRRVNSGANGFEPTPRQAKYVAELQPDGLYLDTREFLCSKARFESQVREDCTKKGPTGIIIHVIIETEDGTRTKQDIDLGRIMTNGINANVYVCWRCFAAFARVGPLDRHYEGVHCSGLEGAALKAEKARSRDHITCWHSPHAGERADYHRRDPGEVAASRGIPYVPKVKKTATEKRAERGNKVSKVKARGGITKSSASATHRPARRANVVEALSTATSPFPDTTHFAPSSITPFQQLTPIGRLDWEVGDRVRSSYLEQVAAAAASGQVFSDRYTYDDAHWDLVEFARANSVLSFDGTNIIPEVPRQQAVEQLLWVCEFMIQWAPNHASFQVQDQTGSWWQCFRDGHLVLQGADNLAGFAPQSSFPGTPHSALSPPLPTLTGAESIGPMDLQDGLASFDRPAVETSYDEASILSYDYTDTHGVFGFTKEDSEWIRSTTRETIFGDY